jgi:hypothetical protein
MVQAPQQVLWLATFVVTAAMKLSKVLDAFELPVHKMKVATFIGPSCFLYAAPYNGV